MCTMWTLQQFINWRYLDRGGSKPAKVPFDPATGRDINHLDPANWRMFDECRATGHPVGFVLTKDDPYFLIDIDNCYDPATKQWSEIATKFCDAFAGAFIEVSVSGRGLHIIGTCEQAAVSDRRNRIDSIGVEFYYKDRFVALRT